MVKDAKNQSMFTILLVVGGGKQYDFTEFSGGAITRDAEDYPDGLSDEMQSTVGIKRYQNITIRTPYKPAIHDPLSKKMLNFCGESLDCVVTPIKICPERTEDGQSRVYQRLIPINVQPPEVNRGGSGVSIFQLEFKVQAFKYA